MISYDWPYSRLVLATDLRSPMILDANDKPNISDDWWFRMIQKDQ